MSGKKNAYNISYEAVSELSLDLAYGSTDQNDILLTQENPFADPIVAEYYKEVYEKAGYECRDAFDPLFEWSKSEEDNIIRKLDYRVALTACILFAGLQIDRGNLGQAVSDNMLDDLGLDTNNYNTGNTIFLVCFLLAELPSQLISKALGPDIFIPIQIVTWSVVAMSQGIIKGKLSFYLTRGLIGMLEGGFIADIVLWLTYFYKAKELPIRLSWMALVVYIGGIMYFLHWLNLLFLMVPSATQTKNSFHPKGWFSDREVKIVVNRVLRDDPSKGDMHNRQGLSFKAILDTLSDYDLWPIYVIGLIAYIPTGALSPYLTLTLKQLGFSTFNVNLLTIPYSILHIIMLLMITWISEAINERALVCLILPIWSIPLLALLRWWSGSMVNVWGTWLLCTLFLGGPYIHAICVSWVSRNSNSIKTRTIASALYNMSVQMGSIISYNIYRKDDAPLYHRGNQTLFKFAILMFPILLLVKLYYVYRNKSRDIIWNKMTLEQQEDYINNTSDVGNKRLDFRFDH
ncbi:uncharacterized protein AC631_02636 [Debaryomyces fabryi]|uniref:Major facilitator superfamily (MFS) profile domain-containing protein n=1 Tax=Debaryomyces fabryi TaxID=58627 RepID=A0A0V1PZF2_9ASCO|nr:uncharacterized protein AC631_02636 [Debaryomyces fabryi]KSA01627.1 hypothetical protein AC631_02636 [Debaryomyces fabryi]